MRTDEERLADWHAGIVEACGSAGRPAALAYADQVVYYVVAVRSEMDLVSFASVFEQLLTIEELDFFIGALKALKEPDLAAAFKDARGFLTRQGFEPGMGNPVPLPARRTLKNLELRARSQGSLWSLDAKLLQLRDVPEAT